MRCFIFNTTIFQLKGYISSKIFLLKTYKPATQDFCLLICILLGFPLKCFLRLKKTKFCILWATILRVTHIGAFKFNSFLLDFLVPFSLLDYKTFKLVACAVTSIPGAVSAEKIFSFEQQLKKKKKKKQRQRRPLKSCLFYFLRRLLKSTDIDKQADLQIYKNMQGQKVNKYIRRWAAKEFLIPASMRRIRPIK